MTGIVLYILIYAGPWAKGDSVTLVEARVRFATMEQCEAHAKQLKPLVKDSAKEIKTICAKT